MSRLGKGFSLVFIGLFLLSSFMLEHANGQAMSGTPTVLWQKSFSFPAGTKDNTRDWTAPILLDDVVYVGAKSAVNTFPYLPPSSDYVLDWWCDFYAFNASNGNIIWDYRDDSAYLITSCVAKNGIVFFGEKSDNLNFSDPKTYILALNSSSGTLLRKYNVNGEISSPLLVNDVVFFWGGSYDNGYILALNSSTLDLLWDYNIKGIVSQPAVANNIVYFYGSDNSTLYALNAINGQKIWDTHNYERTDPKIVNGVIYVGYFFYGPNKNGQIPSYGLHAIDASNGKLLWEYDTDFWVCQPIVTGGAVYFASDKNVYSLNAMTGAKIWNYTTPHTPRTDGIGDTFTTESQSPIVNNGIVYFYSVRAGNLFAFKASNGDIIWNYTRALGNPPIVANGAVYVRIQGHPCALDAYNGSKIWASKVSANQMSITPNALYFSGGKIFYALKLVSPSSAVMPSTILQALTDKGQTVNLTIDGNLTSSQISNVYITSDNVSSTIYLDATGASGNSGFSNITIARSLICNGTLPSVYIDDQIAETHGYVQDADNYYVWYITDFSTHHISIIFTRSSVSASTSAITPLTIAVIALAFFAAAIIFSLLVLAHKKTVAQRKTT
jgi:outer membrane protein assembly factor BamB